MRYSDFLVAALLGASPLAAQQIPPLGAAPASGGYALRVGDLVRVEVWGHPEFSGQFVVDESGHLQYPVIGDIEVSSLTIVALRDRMRHGLEQIFKSPFVTVTPLFRMAVLGQVRNPGLYTVNAAFSVLDVVALAGGPAPSGNMNKARLPRGGEAVRLSFERAREHPDVAQAS